ncbi:hypothetical protein [Microcoleus sp.]|uniref:hypothetical protein n=1 Tax=Microcoleus sp. TaxID=44472 RepID=UPI00403E6743
MPVPQRMSFLVEQASCLFLNGQDARSTKNEFSCGTGILPVPKQVIENGAISQFNLTYIRLYRLCVMGALQTI